MFVVRVILRTLQLATLVAETVIVVLGVTQITWSSKCCTPNHYSGNVTGLLPQSSAALPLLPICILSWIVAGFVGIYLYRGKRNHSRAAMTADFLACFLWAAGSIGSSIQLDREFSIIQAVGVSLAWFLCLVCVSNLIVEHTHYMQWPSQSGLDGTGPNGARGGGMNSNAPRKIVITGMNEIEVERIQLEDMRQGGEL